MNQDKTFLGTEPVGKLLLKLSVPTVIAQLVNMLYNIVDRIYIGRGRVSADHHDRLGVRGFGQYRRRAAGLHLHGQKRPRVGGKDAWKLLYLAGHRVSRVDGRSAPI